MGYRLVFTKCATLIASLYVVYNYWSNMLGKMTWYNLTGTENEQTTYRLLHSSAHIWYIMYMSFFAHSGVLTLI